MKQFLKILNHVVVFGRQVFRPIRWLAGRISRRRAAILVEVFALSVGVVFTLTSYSILREVGGMPLPLAPSNANFLEKDEYEGPVTDLFSVRHNCKHMLTADLNLYLRPNSQPHQLHQPLTWYSALWRLNPLSGNVSAGDVEVQLKFDNFDEAGECEFIAIHVPGDIAEFSYLVRRDGWGEWIRAEPIAAPDNSQVPLSKLTAGAKILIPLKKYPKFETIGFVWKDAIEHLGDYDIGIKVRSGYLQNLEPSASNSVSGFLTKVHSPRGYSIKSASYREDREPQKYSHSSGPVHIFSFNGLSDDTPLAVRFTKRVGTAERESRLILWSALLGLGIGLMIEATFSLLRTIASPGNPNAT